MNVHELLCWVLLLISVARLISGAVQIFAPGFTLGLVAGEIIPDTQQGILILWYMKLAGNQKNLP
jgi:hypothetical protein